MIGGILARLLSWLMGRLFGGSQPSQEAKASATAAAAQTSLNVEVQANADVQKAADARNAVDADLLNKPDSVHDDDGFKRPD